MRTLLLRGATGALQKLESLGGTRFRLRRSPRVTIASSFLILATVVLVLCAPILWDSVYEDQHAVFFPDAFVEAYQSKYGVLRKKAHSWVPGPDYRVAPITRERYTELWASGFRGGCYYEPPETPVDPKYIWR